MRFRPVIGLLAGALLASHLATPGLTQSYQQGSAPQNYPAFPSGGGGGYGWGGFGGGGGTVAGSYLHGMGDVVRSAGYANVMNSLATQNYEQAYSQDLDNRLKATNTYFEMRRVNAAARAENQAPRASPQELARYAAEAAPKRLTASELDPVSGEVNWPALFGDAQYGKMRDNVDRLFSQRQATSSSSGDYRAIVTAIDALRAALRNNIGDYSPAAYVEARKFLDSLQYEARFVNS